MKKFRFSLDIVLSYKQQVLDTLQGEHALILAQVNAQEDVVDGLWEEYRAYNREFAQQKAQGLTITEALIYESGLRAAELEIQRETEKLTSLRKQEEKKREEVVEAKKETSSLEKLKEKKYAIYQKALSKSEEQLIEEFVSNASKNCRISA